MSGSRDKKIRKLAEEMAKISDLPAEAYVRELKRRLVNGRISKNKNTVRV